MNLKECNNCKNNGFPGQQIWFEKTGEEPSSGKAIWKLHNEDGTDHQHKRKEGSSSSFDKQKYYKEREAREEIRSKAIQAMHEANIASNNALKESIEKLVKALEPIAAAIEGLSYAFSKKNEEGSKS
jgi:hypothetical protein